MKKKIIFILTLTLFSLPLFSQRAPFDNKNWDIKTLDTARNASYLTDLEKDIILETNKVRTDPKKYTNLYIKPTLKYYKGKNYSVPNKITIVTNEGVVAVSEAIAVLSRAESVGLLTPEKGLSLGAKDHVNDQGKTGRTGHDGADGSDPFTRVERYGVIGRTAGENITYGPTTGRDIIVQLLVDDGVPDRGHRVNIMSKDFTQIGVAYGKHTQYRAMSAMVYADGYVGKE